MTGPARRLPPDDGNQVVRLARFKAAHPDVVVAAGEFGTWQARIPKENGETVITRHRLGELLDRLGAICPDSLARAASAPSVARQAGRTSTTDVASSGAARRCEWPRPAGMV